MRVQQELGLVWLPRIQRGFVGAFPDLDILPLLTKRMHLQACGQKPALEIQNTIGHTGMCFDLQHRNK